ncbi:hypothetical protein [Parafilimonas sp.]|uniref:hypothetical protein n=1 Tax=Parafilimonas sp. TaxID=1969739 RepID=UPI0039E3D217
MKKSALIIVLLAAAFQLQSFKTVNPKEKHIIFRKSHATVSWPIRGTETNTKGDIYYEVYGSGTIATSVYLKNTTTGYEATYTLSYDGGQAEYTTAISKTNFGASGFGVTPSSGYVVFIAEI